ncbi:MAG TPA: hypothetical protein VN695_21565 [Streptosporangiaceae bacterium]|nr:hypothetical protein [Streptosporangiaceae bacterium]
MAASIAQTRRLVHRVCAGAVLIREGGEHAPMSWTRLCFCRRHHRTKQAPGWHVTQPQPGTFTWTAPHGRTYTTCPDRYLT